MMKKKKNKNTKKLMHKQNLMDKKFQFTEISVLFYMKYLKNIELSMLTKFHLNLEQNILLMDNRLIWKY